MASIPSNFKVLSLRFNFKYLTLRYLYSISNIQTLYANQNKEEKLKIEYIYYYTIQILTHIKLIWFEPRQFDSTVLNQILNYLNIL